MHRCVQQRCVVLCGEHQVSADPPSHCTSTQKQIMAYPYSLQRQLTRLDFYYSKRCSRVFVGYLVHCDTIQYNNIGVACEI